MASDSLTASYELMDHLGAGPHGSVFIAHNKVSDKLRAVKIFSLAKLDDDQKEKLKSELTRFQKIQSERLIRYYNTYEDQDCQTLSVVMDYLPLGSLAAEMDRRTIHHSPYTEQQIWAILGQICLALKAVYTAMGSLQTSVDQSVEISHGNLKPSNILLTDSGLLALTDYGLTHQAITNETVVDTIDAVPEAALTSSIVNTQQGDIWCLGRIAFELCCVGFPGFVGSGCPTPGVLTAAGISLATPPRPPSSIAGLISASPSLPPTPSERPQTSKLRIKEVNKRGTRTPMSQRGRDQDQKEREEREREEREREERERLEAEEAAAAASQSAKAQTKMVLNPKLLNHVASHLSQNLRQLIMTCLSIGNENDDCISSPITLDSILSYSEVKSALDKLKTGELETPVSRSVSRSDDRRPQAKDKQGNTPLHRAVLDRNLQELSKNLGYAGEYNTDGVTALILCAQTNFIEGAKILASKESRKLCSANKLALYYALVKGNLEIAEILTQWESFTDQEPYIDNHKTNLMRSVMERNILAVWYWKMYQAGMQDTEGRTALIIAAEVDFFNAVRVLAPHEARVKMTNGKTAIDIALDHNHLDIATFLIPYEGTKEDELDFNGRTSLMQAAIKNNRLGVFCFLKEAKAIDNEEGMTALMLAAKHGSCDVLKYLIPHEKYMRSSTGKTALMYATEANMLDVIVDLIPYEYCADPREYSALNIAIEKGFAEAADLLSAYEGTECEWRYTFKSAKQRIVTQQTALMAAAENASAKFAYCNLHQLAMQTPEGMTALMYACQAKSKDCVDLLVSEKDLQASDGKTAWLIAFDGGFKDVLDQIQPTSKCDENGNTDLHKAALIGEVSNIRTLMRLVKRINNNDMSALMIASTICSNDDKVDSVLIDVESTIINSKGQFAAKFAMLAGNYKLAKILIDYEKDLLKADGFTDLMIAAVLNRIEDVFKYSGRALGQKKPCASQLRMQTVDGYTALMLAARAGHESVVSLLLAEVGMQDKEGLYAADYAIRGDNYTIIQSLASQELVIFEKNYTLASFLNIIKDFDTKTALKYIKSFYYNDFRSLQADDNQGVARLYYETTQLATISPLEEKDIVQDLLRDELGETPLHTAVRNDDLLSIRKYLYRSGEVNNEGVSAAELALDLGRIQIAKILLKVEMPLLKEIGFTNLMLASFFGDEERFEKCIGEKGAITGRGHTAFMLAANQGHYDMAERLAEEKEMVDKDGRPVHLICPKEDGSYRVLSTRYPNTIEGLHLAVKDRSIDGVRALIAHAGARYAGWTALARAAENGFAEAIPLLVEKEAKMTIDITFKCMSANLRGLLAIHIAALKGHANVVRLLLDAEGGSVERAIGFTSLMISAYMGHAHCVKELIAREAKMFERTGSATALWYAAYCGHLDCVELLAPLEANLKRREGNTIGMYACSYACSVSNGEAKQDVLAELRKHMTANNIDAIASPGPRPRN